MIRDGLGQNSDWELKLRWRTQTPMGNSKLRQGTQTQTGNSKLRWGTQTQIGNSNSHRELKLR